MPLDRPEGSISLTMPESFPQAGNPSVLYYADVKKTKEVGGIKMLGSTHEIVTKKAIEFLNSQESGFSLAGYKLANNAEQIAKANSNTDHLFDLELVDVEGSKNTGRDDPHKSEADAIDDKPHYKMTLGSMELYFTSMNHFIDIRKGEGRFDDYDGYSYQSAKNKQTEKELGKYIDDWAGYWLNDEYVHAPGQPYYRNCSPSVWNYSYPSAKGKYRDKYAELAARFPLAEYKGKSGKGIPYSVFMPVDNLGRYWYEKFLQSGALADLGPVLHAVQDAAVPQHAAGYMGNYHRAYEDALKKDAASYVTNSTFRTNVLQLYNRWKNIIGTVPSLSYPNDYGRIPGPNWRVDYLITWMAFQAYRDYKTVYGEFKTFKNLSTASSHRLLECACALSMLVLMKARKEYVPHAPAKKVVNGIRIIANTISSKAKNAFPSEYTVIGKDLNKGSGGCYIYLGYTLGDEGRVTPITNLTLVNYSKSQSWSEKMITVNGITAKYYRLTVDLNKGSGGKYIYLCYTYDKQYKPLTGIDVCYGGDTIASYWDIITWAGTKTNADVNKGSGGKYIYILQRRI